MDISKFSWQKKNTKMCPMVVRVTTMIQNSTKSVVNEKGEIGD